MLERERGKGEIEKIERERDEEKHGKKVRD